MTSGTDVIRQAVAARMKKLNTANWAREMKVASSTLDDFAAGKAQLPPDILNSLAKYIFGAAVSFDAQADLLRRAAPQVSPLGCHPPRYVPPPNFKLPTSATYSPAKQAQSKPLPKAKPAGWA
jgi:hypothetical protein